MSGDREKRTTVTQDPVQDQAMEPVLDQATNLLQDQATEFLQDKAMELLKELDTEGPQDQATEPAQVQSTEAPQDQATEPALVQSMVVPQDQATERPESPSTARPCACCSASGESLSEAEEKFQKLVASSAQLEDRVRELEGLLYEAHRECEAKTMECEQQRQSHSILQSQYNEMKELSHQNEEFLKVSLADAEQKHQKALESINQLEGEKSDLMHQVKTLRASVQEMGELLVQTHRECDELTKKCEQKQEDHRVLLLEFDEMKKVLTHKKELLKVSLADAEQKHQKAQQSITQLEREKSHLMYQVQRLYTSLQEMEELLSQSHECE